MNELDTTSWFLLIIIILFVGVFILVGGVWFFSGFLSELKYLNSEIARTTGSERMYWKSRRRRLFLSLIPFVKY